MSIWNWKFYWFYFVCSRLFSHVFFMTVSEEVGSGHHLVFERLFWAYPLAVFKTLSVSVYKRTYIMYISYWWYIYIYIIHTSYWWYMMVMNPGQKGGILYPQHQDIFDVDQLLRSIVCHGPRWYKVENLVLDVPAPKNGVLAQKQGGKLSVHGVVHGIRRWWDFCRICRRQTLEPVDTP